MTQLDTDALAQITGAVQRGRLSPKEKIAVYAFTQRGVPAKILARLFDVRANAIYYIANGSTLRRIKASRMLSNAWARNASGPRSSPRSKPNTSMPNIEPL